MNIDAQDAQDNQDGRLLHETLTRAMIVCGFEDVREHKPAVSGKNPVHPVHRCESKIYPCLTMNRFPATRRRRLFQVSRAPALPGGSYESETGFVSVTRTDGPPSTTTGAKMLLHFCPVGVTLSWEEAPPGSAGVPPAQILPQLRPSPPPESTGSGALPLLRPGPCGSRRQGGRLQHRRETERQPKGQHAGGTPALPGGVVPMVRWGVSGGRLL